MHYARPVRPTLLYMTTLTIFCESSKHEAPSYADVSRLLTVSLTFMMLAATTQTE